MLKIALEMSELIKYYQGISQYLKKSGLATKFGVDNDDSVNMTYYPQFKCFLFRKYF